MQVIFKGSKPTAKNIKTFYFEPPTPVDYLPGQFTQLYLPHDNPDERGEKHWFTLSSSPTEKLLSITTKFSHPSSSFKSQLLKIKVGSKISAADPMGDFVLPKNLKKPLLFVAGGIGVTPFRSMIKFLSDTKQKRPIKLIYSVSDPGELAFTDLLTTYLGDNFMPITKQPPASWIGTADSLSGQTILDHGKPANESLIYLSGPEPMIENLEQQLLKLGIAKQQLVTDFFPGYSGI